MAERAPVCESPLGPVWSLPAADLGLDFGGEMLLRRLADPVDFLSTGAVLRLAADNDGARSHAPSFWARIEDAVWIAQRAPHGAPLAVADFEPRSWAEALELWRPLAEAIAHGHRKGAIHGLLSPWTVWFDDEAGRLVAVDSGAWIGDAIPDDQAWWAPELRAPSDRRQPSPAVDVWGLARLLLFLTLPLDEASAASPSLGQIPAYAIPGISRALQTDAVERLQRVGELITATSPAPLRTAHVDRIPDGRDVLYGRAFDVESIEHPQHGPGVKFMLTFPAYDEHGAPIGHETTGSFFYSTRGRDIYESVRHVWEGSELNLLDAAEIEDSKGNTFFTAQAATLPVLEPHWPVTVTNTLKADGCVSKYFVDLRDSGKPGRPLVFGSLLHGMLDDIATARGELPTFEESYDARIPGMRLAFIAAGLSDDDLPRLRKEAREHFINIAGFARGRDADRKERVGWTGENVEVTRYSSVYGLEGRIDLVTEDPRAGLHIVELKSGSERDEHASQVRCYRLLWDGVAEHQDMAIHGYLLYSRSGLMRSAPTEDPLRERRILRARNQLVAAQKAISEGDEAFQLPYYLMEPANCHAFCKFRKDRCRAQSLLLGIAPGADATEVVQSQRHPWFGFDASVVDAAWLYWRHFSRLTELENWAEGERIGRILQSGRVQERVRSHDAVADLSLAAIDLDAGEVTFEGRVPRIFMKNDAIVAHRGDFHAEHILRGNVVDLTPTSLRIRTHGAPNAEGLAPDGWIVDSLPFRMGHRASIQSMYGFLARQDDRLLRILLQPKSKEAHRDTSPAAANIAVSPETSQALNDKQVEAVQWGLGTHGGCLIQGPPGTGKTTVIAHLVRELLEDGQRVIVSAQTNTAVDTVLMALVDVGVRDFMRVGPASRSESLVSVLAEAGEDPLEFFSHDVAIGTESLDKLARRVAYTRVIGCTTHKAIRDDIFNFLRADNEVPFDVAIVDEATQISEPMTLAPLRLARRFVLVGDHRQLPPIVNNERATTAAVDGYSWFDLDDAAAAAQSQLGLFAGPATSRPDPTATPIGLGGLDRSLFERLIEQGLPHVMLEEQYRMADEIQAFSSRRYYQGRLQAHDSVASARLGLNPEAVAQQPEHVQAVIGPDAPVVFCDVAGEDHARTNAAEADAVVETVRALLACGAGHSRRNIGVVTPFRAQAQLIRRLLAERLGERAAQVEVDTVERYQGSERDTIIVSLVKTDHAGEFLSDHRRVNVTLTRARRKLILFGNRECLMMSPLFRAIIEQDETVRTAWPA